MARESKKAAAAGFSPWGENATDGGGISGATAVLKTVDFVQEFTYGGRFKDKPKAALHTVYEIEGFGKPWEDHWPIGDSDKWDVSKDGYGIKPSAGQTGLNKKSGAFFFFDALEQAIETQGLDREDFVEVSEDGINVEALEGQTVTLVNKPFEQFSGETKDKAVIASLVTDAKPGRASAGKSAAANGNGGGKLEKRTAAAILALLEDGPVKIADLPNLVFAANRKEPDVKDMMNLAYKDAFLGGIEGVEVKKKMLQRVEED